MIAIQGKSPRRKSFMPKLAIYVDFDDHTDLQFAFGKLVAVVKEQVEEMVEENRFDSEVEVDWELDYE